MQRRVQAQDMPQMRHGERILDIGVAPIGDSPRIVREMGDFESPGLIAQDRSHHSDTQIVRETVTFERPRTLTKHICHARMFAKASVMVKPRTQWRSGTPASGLLDVRPVTITFGRE